MGLWRQNGESHPSGHGSGSRDAPCPVGECDGSGWIVDASEEARRCRCEVLRARKRVNRGVNAVIPPRYRGVSFDRPPVSDIDPTVVGEVRRFCDGLDESLDTGRGLWLMGDVGTGKTTLAMLVSKAALEAGRTVAIYSLPRLLARIRRTYDADAGEDSYLDLVHRLSAVDLLHIDDLGAEKSSDWVLEQLYSLINARYEEERSIVVTTNLDEAALGEQIGHRTVSRLVEMCGDPLPLFGPDRRVEYRPAREPAYGPEGPQAS